MALRSANAGLVVMLVLGLTGCGAPGAGTEGADVPGEAATSAAEPPFELTLMGAEPLISDADVDLAMPAAIDVDAAGNVWIADRTLHHLLIVGPQGEILRTLGRAGGGPGEFRAPRGIGVRGAYAYVLDVAHGVQRFEMDGTYVDEYDPASLAVSDFDFTGDGGMVLSGNRVWAVGGLVQLLGPDGSARALVGEPLFPAEDFNFAEIRRQILDGEIPAAVRNGALPVVAPDGSLWAVVHTELMVRRYGADGRLLFETPFELPELPAIVAQYHEDFLESLGRDAFFFPTFAAAGVAVGDHLLLLWETVAGRPGLITVHGPQGDLVQRWLLPELDMGGGGFDILTMAFDAERRRLLIGASEVATIFAIDLPESARLPSR